VPRSLWSLPLLVLTACGPKDADDSGAYEDSAAPESAVTPEDIDGDGYGADVDCDDADPAVSPGAGEAPYDGVDNDCDAATPDDDLDGDGYLADEDCDDSGASRWDQVGTFTGDIDSWDLNAFCTAWCERGVSGSVDLSGLERLQSVGGAVWVYNNTALAALSGLSGLADVGGFVA